MRTETKTLIAALRVLATDIKTEDGVANAAIAEAVDRLEEFKKYHDFCSSITWMITEGGDYHTKAQILTTIKNEWRKYAIARS